MRSSNRPGDAKAELRFDAKRGCTIMTVYAERPLQYAPMGSAAARLVEECSTHIGEVAAEAAEKGNAPKRTIFVIVDLTDDGGRRLAEARGVVPEGARSGFVTFDLSVESFRRVPFAPATAVETFADDHRVGFVRVIIVTNGKWHASHVASPLG